MHLRKKLSIILLIPILFFTSGRAEQAVPLSDEERALIEGGDVVVREVTGAGAGKTFEAIGLIRASVSEVYAVLTDFKDYPKFLPNLETVEIIERKKGAAVLNYTLSLPLDKVKKYRLNMAFEESEEKAAIYWNMLEWPGLKQNETIEDTTGYWSITAYPEKKNHVLVVYHVYTDPGPIPIGLGWIVDILTESSVPQTIIKTRERVYQVFKR